MRQENQPDSANANNQDNQETETLLVLIDTMFGELSQPITVATGVSHLLLSQIDEDNPMAGDLKIILNQMERIKETSKGVKYITRYNNYKSQAVL